MGPTASNILVSGEKPIPRIIVGTSRIGTFLPERITPSREKLFRYLDSTLQQGCCAFDTAASYQLGGSERALGHWIRLRRNREELFLIVKGANSYPIVRRHPLRRSIIRSDFDSSLRRLGTDHAELFMLHRDDPTAPLDPVVEALNDLYAAGKFFAWGVSNWAPDRIQALTALTASSGLPPIAASSPQFSLAEWVKPPYPGSSSISGESNRAARAFYRKLQLPVLAWSPLAQGFLATSAPGGPANYQSAQNLARKQRTIALAGKVGVAPSQIALAYLFNQPFPVFAIVATRRIENVRKNLAATSIQLSEADLTWLERGEQRAA